MNSSSSVMSVIAISVVFVALTWTGLGYVTLKSYFPGRGLGMIRNVFKKTIVFQEAVNALKEGKRIRRKHERRGYTKLVVTAGKDKKEVYAMYYADSKDEAKPSAYNSFSIEDIFATDWLIDE